MKRQRAALGMAVMMAVSSLSGSYVSASAMETWQAEAMILEEDISSAWNLEEMETESESESGLDGVSNGLEMDAELVGAPVVRKRTKHGGV